MAGMMKLARSLSRLSLGSMSQCKHSGTTAGLKLTTAEGFLSRCLRPQSSWLPSLRLPELKLPSENMTQHTHCRTMASLRQMHKNGRPRKNRKRQGLLDGCPQKKGVVLKVIIKKPKKPNSANRKCVRVKLSTGKQAVAFVPGEGHNLQEHNIVLLKGGKKQDLPGVKLKVVRGKYDCGHVVK